MRTLEVNYKGETNEDFNVVIEKRRGPDMPWELAARTTQKPGAKTYMLEPHERLVIETFGAEVEMVFDREQNATMPRSAFESQPDAGAKQQMEDDRQKEVHDQRFDLERNEGVASQAADRERDRVLEEQRLRDEERKVAEGAKARTEALDKQVKETSPVAPKPPVAPAPTPPFPPRPTPGQSDGQSAGQGGMTAPGPSTGGQSSKDVK